MDEPYLSQIWYRVARLKPRLRPHVKVHRHRYRGEPWYVLYDPATGRVHRFTPGAYLIVGQLDGTRSVDEVWQALARTHDAEVPSQDDVIRLLSRLHQNDLIQYPSNPDIAELLQRYDKQSTQVLKQNLTNPVSFRIPMWDPDRFLTRTLPLVRPLTGRVGLFLWLAVVLAGLIVGALEWDRLAASFSDQLLSAGNLAILAVSYVVIKALHELAHGYLAKARGGDVRETGIMLLVFFPVPYVDASSAAAFRNKWDRAAVAAGGIFAETFIAGIAMLVWAMVEPGIVSAIAYNVILIGGLSTLVVNGNPLLKFDGYYVMADLIESPNLANRSNTYWGFLIQRYLFGASQVKREPATPGERAWFVFYAPAAFVYRIVVMLGIAFYVSAHAFVLGVAIACLSLFNALIKPAFKNLRHVVTAPKLRKVRRRAVGITFGTIAALVGALLLVPVPLRTEAEGVVWLPDEAHVRARTSGFVETVAVPRGARVGAQDILARLAEPALDARLEALAWRAEEHGRRLASLRFVDRPGAEIAALELAEARAEEDRERTRSLQLALRAPIAGRFEPVREPASLIGRYVAEGDLVGWVLPDRADRVRVVVLQDDVALVRERMSGAVVALAGSLGERHATRLLREVPSALDTLPSPALGSTAGGRVLADPSDPERLRALEAVFLFDLALPEAIADAPFGQRVRVAFHHGSEPIGLQLWRRLSQLLLRHFDV